MTEKWPDRLAGGFSCLAASVEPQVWYHASTAERDRPSFFFAWGPADAGARCESAVVDRDSQFLKSARANLDRAPGYASAFDVDSVLAAVKRDSRSRTSAADGDDVDDLMLRVSCTKLFDRSRRESDPDRYVNPFATPYLALSMRRSFRARGVVLGDFATALNLRTGRIAHAVVGDDREIPVVDPSPALAEHLDLAAADRTIYLVHPGTGQGQGVIPANEDIRRQGERFFRARAWSVILGEFAQRLVG